MSEDPLAKILLDTLVERAPEAPPTAEAGALEARLRELRPRRPAGLRGAAALAGSALPCPARRAPISLRRSRAGAARRAARPRGGHASAHRRVLRARRSGRLAARRRHPHCAAAAQRAEEARRQRPRGCGPPPFRRGRPRARLPEAPLPGGIRAGLPGRIIEIIEARAAL